MNFTLEKSEMKKWTIFDSQLERVTEESTYDGPTGHSQRSLATPGELISWYGPEVRTVMDMGGRTAKAINVGEREGSQLIMNDKCAAGTGREWKFLRTFIRFPVWRSDPVHSTFRKEPP